MSVKEKRSKIDTFSVIFLFLCFGNWFLKSRKRCFTIFETRNRALLVTFILPKNECNQVEENIPYFKMTEKEEIKENGFDLDERNKTLKSCKTFEAEFEIRENVFATGRRGRRRVPFFVKNDSFFKEWFFFAKNHSSWCSLKRCHKGSSKFKKQFHVREKD